MTEEIRTLVIGGQEAAVQVREAAVAPEETSVATSVAQFAEQLFVTYNQGIAWPKDTFFGKSGSEILQAIRLFAEKVNYARAQAKEPSLNALELETVVEQQSASLALSLQNLCRWTVLVRLGVRKVQRDLLGLVSMLPMPSRGSVKLNRPADSVGRTHYVVSHLFGAKFLCRGYALQFNDEGDWTLGGATNNRWFKDLWLTPGLQTIDALTASKRKKLRPSHRSDLSKREQKALAQTVTNFKGKVEATRAAAGISAENFSAAHGARLDLENKAIMVAALQSVRSLLAQAIVYQEDKILDGIAGRCGGTKADLLDDPSIAGREQDSVQHHLARRYEAYKHFRPVGNLEMPKGYMVFAEHGVPDRIPAENRTELTGVSGVCVGADYLATRYDVGSLKRNPSALPEVEDLTPLINVCGVTTLNGKLIDDMDLVVRGESEETPEGVDYMRYDVAGQPSAEMPLAEFLRKTSVRFIPMVVNFQRRRLNAEDLQGTRDGLSWAVSFDDVNERFRPCPKKKRQPK